MSSRSNRAVLAHETLAIIEAGGYTHPETQMWVDIDGAVAAAKAGTRVVSWTTVEGWSDHASSEPAFDTEITVANETTFAAGRRLAVEGDQICCLNFASAKNPGGGFLNGSKAQEEDLAKSSALYPCLLEGEEYYKLNRAGTSSLYLDLLIFSPRIPVFRDDEGVLLDRAWASSVITGPAPNAGAVRNNEPDREAEIESTFLKRIGLVLETAAHFGARRLVLGAWGCGVFQNDPTICARLFREALEHTKFATSFSLVHFAVLDRSKDLGTYLAFENEFGNWNCG